MSRQHPMQRRAFLKGLGSSAAVGLASPALLAALTGCGGPDAVAPALAGFFDDPRSAREIGREYLKIAPDEQDPDILVERLVVDQGREWNRLAQQSPAQLFEAVRERHLADFVEERTVLVRGWVLSQTEARLCALQALDSEPRE